LGLSFRRLVRVAIIVITRGRNALLERATRTTPRRKRRRHLIEDLERRQPEIRFGVAFLHSVFPSGLIHRKV
ncbi:hypothetical protein PENTCL1PPCAC_8890, partial [Pristionchus entomophagus]